MTDHEYAALVYCRAFNVMSDNGEAYVRGILDAIKTLDEREWIVLEKNLRFNESYADIGEDLGISKQRVRQYVDKAIQKLRHPYRLKMMNVSKLIKQKDKQLEEANTLIDTLYNQIEILLDGGILDHKIKEALELRKASVHELNISNRTLRLLLHMGIYTIEALLALDTLDVLTMKKGFGIKSKNDVIEAMRERGYIDWANQM